MYYASTIFLGTKTVPLLLLFLVSGVWAMNNEDKEAELQKLLADMGLKGTISLGYSSCTVNGQPHIPTGNGPLIPAGTMYNGGPLPGNAYVAPKEKKEKKIKNSENIITVKRAIKPFHSIEIPFGECVIDPAGDQNEIELTGEASIVEKLNVKTYKDILLVFLPDGLILKRSSQPPLKCRVGLGNKNKISLYGACLYSCTKKLFDTIFYLKSYENTRVQLHIENMEELVISVYDKSCVNVMGNVERQQVYTYDNGCYEGYALTSKKTTVDANYESVAKIGSTQQLTEIKHGNAIIHYERNPVITR